MKISRDDLFWFLVICIMFLWSLALDIETSIYIKNIEKQMSYTTPSQRVFWISAERYLRIGGDGETREVILLSYSLDGVPQLPVEIQSENQLGKYMAWVEKKYRGRK